MTLVDNYKSQMTASIYYRDPGADSQLLMRVFNIIFIRTMIGYAILWFLEVCPLDPGLSLRSFPDH